MVVEDEDDENLLDNVSNGNSGVCGDMGVLLIS